MKKYCLLFLFSFQVSAAVINPKGVGEFLLIPYYTVNNNLNTLVSIINTTDRAKAVKINFREGLNGHAVFTYNVYLDPNDIWTFALAETESTINSNIGQPSVIHLTSDLSCAPYLDTNGHEFLPTQLVDGQQNLERAREGFIEVFEMAEVSEEFAAEFGFNEGTDLSDNCSIITDAWSTWFLNNETGEILTEQMSRVTGGLTAEASIIDVAEGINYPIPVTALADFFPDDTIVHSPPGDTSLSFDAAKPQATVISDDGAIQLDFDNGTDATSALFMTNELLAPFDLFSAIAGQTELVFVQPTRRLYLNEDNISAQAPFPDTNPASNCSDDYYGGSQLDLKMFDREGNNIPPIDGVGVLLPPDPPKSGICGSVFVQSYSLGHNAIVSDLTGSNNSSEVYIRSNDSLSESGLLNVQFIGARAISATTVDDQDVQLKGLPLLGITLQKYTNANAQDGLLAQYGAAHLAKSSIRIIQE